MHKMEIGEIMKTFDLNNRRYLGSKTKLIRFIQEVVYENCQDLETILDLFGGTGVVGYSFSDDYSIIVNDILESNYIAYETFFGEEEVDLYKIANIIEDYNNKECNDDGYYSNNFGDTYLSKENMRKIDYIRDHIDTLYENKKINHRERASLICSLIYAIDKIANTVGHYDAYRKNGNLDKELYMLLPNLYKQDKKHQFFKKDANQLVKEVKADLVYIDPPYNSRQYCDAYHFLENVALNNKPEVSGVARKMDRSDLKSNYCTNKASSEFANLIESIDAKYILVSHNNTGSKGDGRSQAKISDTQILDILGKKGEVKIFEKDFNPFNTGKTVMENHKEQLYLCIVGKPSLPNKKVTTDFVKSPLNYTGGKFKILPQLINKFPKDIDVFYDVFCGGANVGVNIECNQIICLDNNSEVISLLKYLQTQDYYDLVKHLDELIDYYGLSNTYKNGYDYYKCNSSQGVGQFNKDSYIKLREDYNFIRPRRDDLFLLLIIYGFNNQIRFNSDYQFNLPVGKRDFNASLRKKLELFMNQLHSKNIEFKDMDFRDLEVDEDAFLYLDPPYYLGNATYNENGGWSLMDEKDLMKFLNECNAKHIRFALSNVIEHKGHIHQELLDWCILNGYSIYYINSSYNNSNYHLKDKTLETREVLITNY